MRLNMLAAWRAKPQEIFQGASKSWNGKSAMTEAQKKTGAFRPPIVVSLPFRRWSSRSTHRRRGGLRRWRGGGLTKGRCGRLAGLHFRRGWRRRRFLPTRSAILAPVHEQQQATKDQRAQGNGQ